MSDYKKKMDECDAQKILEDVLADKRDKDSTVDKAIETLLAEREEKDKQIEQLQNRCIALTRGSICLFCPMDCKKRTAECRGLKH